MSTCPGLPSEAVLPLNVLSPHRVRGRADPYDSRPPRGDRDLVAAVRAMDAAGESATALDFLPRTPHMVLATRRGGAADGRASLRVLSGAGRRRRTSRPGDGVSRSVLALAASHPDGPSKETGRGPAAETVGAASGPHHAGPFLVLRHRGLGRTGEGACPRGAGGTPARRSEAAGPAAAPVTLLVSAAGNGNLRPAAARERFDSLQESPSSSSSLASPDHDCVDSTCRSRSRAAGSRAQDAGRGSRRGTVTVVARAGGGSRRTRSRMDRKGRPACGNSRASSATRRSCPGADRTHQERLAAEVSPASATRRCSSARSPVTPPAYDVRTALGWYAALRWTRPTPWGDRGGLAESAGRGRRRPAGAVAAAARSPSSALRSPRTARYGRGSGRRHDSAAARSVPQGIREAPPRSAPASATCPAGLAVSLLADATAQPSGGRIPPPQRTDPLRRLRTALGIATDPDPRLARRAADTGRGVDSRLPYVALARQDPRNRPRFRPDPRRAAPNCSPSPRQPPPLLPPPATSAPPGALDTAVPRQNSSESAYGRTRTR